MITATRRLALITFLVSILTACGSGGGSSVAGGGVSGTGISAGAITDFGSIFVNGVEFDLTGADVTIDGQPSCDPKDGCANPLKRGMVVKVQGSFNGTTGTASSAAAEDVVKGPVQSVAGDGLSMVVLGQTVLVDNTTVIDNNIPGQDIRNLIPGVDLVEVHGFVKGNGLIGASFVERELALVEFRVKGFVENTDATTKTFTIGTLTIDYSAADVGDLPSGNPVNGQLVEVKGQNTLVSGRLIATKVEPEGLGVADADQAEIEGFVTSLVSTSDFFVGSQRVLTTGSTIFTGGLQSEIVVGLKLEVEGALAGGVLTATKVSFRDSAKLESDVATATGTAPNLSLTLKGLPGITITTNSQTEFKNGVPAVNDHVRVRGRVAGGNSVIASEVEVRSPDTDVVLQGPVDASPAPANPTFSVFGVLVDTSGVPENNFEGVGDSPIGRAAFFAMIAPTKLVKAQGTLTGNSVSWQEAELED